MFDRIKSALGTDDDQGLTDAGRRAGYGDEPEPEPERLPEERQRLGGGSRDLTTLREKRQEMIEEQLEAERKARENGNRPDMDAPKPENDDRSREKILTRRMELDLGEREQQMATERYDSIDLRSEYWWHPAFSQSEKARSRRDGPDPLVRDADPDGDRMVSHTDAEWSVVWDDPERGRGGVIETDEWERREQRREQDRDRDRNPDDERETRAPEREQDRDDRDRGMSDYTDDRLPTFEEQQQQEQERADSRVPNGVDPADHDREQTSGWVAPDRDEIDVDHDRDHDRDRDRGRSR